MQIFHTLLPESIRVVETRSELDHGQRYWQEEQYVATAVESRQQEFRTVRICAREALADFGYGDHVLVPDAHRAPVWPANIVGSMTHCPGLRAAAVASSSAFVGIGIDAEPHEVLPPEAVELILLPTEQQAVAQLEAEDPSIAWDKLIFSAKESVFKTWFPLARKWLDFLDCEITVDQQSRTFSAHILRTDTLHQGVDLSQMSGTWMADGSAGQGLLATAITVRSN